MSYNKQKLVYKKSPYVGKRQIRRRVVEIVNDMLFVITNNNGSTERKFKNNFSTETIKTYKIDDTIDAVKGIPNGLFYR